MNQAVLIDVCAGESATEAELQELLDTPASPLLGVLDGSRMDGYRLTSSPDVAKRRIEVAAQQLSDGSVTSMRDAP